MRCEIDGLIQLNLHICDVEGRKKPKPKAVFSDDLELSFLNEIDERELRGIQSTQRYQTAELWIG